MTLDTEIRTPKDAVYASHLPVLRAYLTANRLPVVEFGVGRFSTPVLASLGLSLASIETNAEWAAKVADAVDRVTVLTLPRSEKDEFLSLLRSLITDSHAVFVDGDPVSWRGACVQAAIDARAALIIAHDWAGQQAYRYCEIRPSDRYKLAVYRCSKTKNRTAVFVRRGSGIKFLEVEAHTH